jgi:hypothetical protein
MKFRLQPARHDKFSQTRFKFLAFGLNNLPAFPGSKYSSEHPAGNQVNSNGFQCVAPKMSRMSGHPLNSR